MKWNIPIIILLKTQIPGSWCDWNVSKSFKHGSSDWRACFEFGFIYNKQPLKSFLGKGKCWIVKGLACHEVARSNQRPVNPFFFHLSWSKLERTARSLHQRSHVAVCLVVGWLQLLIVNLITNNNNIIIIIMQLFLHRSLNFRCVLGR